MKSKTVNPVPRLLVSALFGLLAQTSVGKGEPPPRQGR